ncbi:MAG: hypothetical protein JO043_08895 [Candidatus Eremiobacteraeota bacterium]|nr:hypothetical protein [Candidatus Eremiobacteraeota bacterium]
MKAASLPKTSPTSSVQHSVAVAQATVPPVPADENADARLVSDAKETVRTYLQALIAGDESTASSQLLANAGTSAAQLSERNILDSSSRIVNLDGRATSNNTASVDADIQTSTGLYYAHYELRRLDTGIVLIREHTYVKS